MTTAQAVVDSHIHFWDTDRFDYPWLQGFSELNRPFVPADLDVGDVLIEALIFVQANPVWDVVDQETAWVQHLRGRRCTDPGVWWPVCHSTAARPPSTPRLQRLSHESGVAGVRQLIQDEPEGFALQPQFVDAVRLAGQFGLTVDLCVRSHQIAEVTKLAELCPEVTFVLDHLGKPDVAAGQWTGWLHDINAMARPGQRPLQAVRPDHRGRRRHSRHEQHPSIPAGSCRRLRAGPLHVRQRLAQRQPPASPTQGGSPSSSTQCRTSPRAKGIESCGAQRWRSTHGPGSPDDDQPDRQPPAAHA